jgi:hypothetical protein
MSFQGMTQRLMGEIPGLGVDLAGAQINEALGKVYDEQNWSFQVQEAGWLTPGLMFASGGQSQGTITTTAYSASVVGDATAAALWIAMTGRPLITELQIRSPYYSLYNIIAFDGANTLTLDRPWMEPEGSGQAYMMYQSYFPAPVSDFKRFIAIRDTTNNAYLDYWSLTQKDLAVLDPERTIFDEPSNVVPYQVDARVGSATLGSMLYELYPHPLSILPYTYSYLRRGPLLSLPADMIPSPLTEEVVLWRGKEVACLWKEANKGEGQRRDMGTDWKFLAAAADKEYVKCLKPVKDRDRDLFELYFSRFVRGGVIGSDGEPFATINSQLNVGS